MILLEQFRLLALSMSFVMALGFYRNYYRYGPRNVIARMFVLLQVKELFRAENVNYESLELDIVGTFPWLHLKYFSLQASYIPIFQECFIK